METRGLMFQSQTLVLVELAQVGLQITSTSFLFLSMLVQLDQLDHRVRKV
jgi:hypothetical protein